MLGIQDNFDSSGQPLTVDLSSTTTASTNSYSVVPVQNISFTWTNISSPTSFQYQVSPPETNVLFVPYGLGVQVLSDTGPDNSGNGTVSLTEGDLGGEIIPLLTLKGYSKQGPRGRVPIIQPLTTTSSSITPGRQYSSMDFAIVGGGGAGAAAYNYVNTNNRQDLQIYNTGGGGGMVIYGSVSIESNQPVFWTLGASGHPSTITFTIAGSVTPTTLTATQGYDAFEDYGGVTTNPPLALPADVYYYMCGGGAGVSDLFGYLGNTTIFGCGSCASIPGPTAVTDGGNGTNDNGSGNTTSGEGGGMTTTSPVLIKLLQNNSIPGGESVGTFYSGGGGAGLAAGAAGSSGNGNDGTYGSGGGGVGVNPGGQGGSGAITLIIS